MLLGEDGPGGIQFDNATLARDAGTVALMIILLEGGFLAERSEVMRALGPAGLLATLGVLLTAGVVALAAHAVVDLGWTHGAAARRRGVVDRRRGRLRRRCAARTSAAAWPRSSRPRAASTTRSRRCS